LTLRCEFVTARCQLIKYTITAIGMPPLLNRANWHVVDFFFGANGHHFFGISVFWMLAGGQLLLSVQQQHADCRYGVILLNFHVTVNSNNFIGMPSLKRFRYYCTLHSTTELAMSVRRFIFCFAVLNIYIYSMNENSSFFA
jgi:hypothetical protein